MNNILKSILLFFCLMSGGFSYSQADADCTLVFNVNYDGTPLELDDAGNADSVSIEVFKMYISNVELWDRNQQVFVEENSFHLLDAENKGSLSLALDLPEEVKSFSRLKFDVGIDSLTNVSGAFGGDLDPTNGMYWTWQSGYINFKLEGSAPQCPARHNRFQYHIGGYLPPYSAIQSVELEVSSTKKVDINIAIDKIFEQIKIEESYQIMSPNEQSVAFSAFIPSLFTVTK